MACVNSEVFKKWCRKHAWNKDYIPISGTEVNGSPAIVFFHEGDEYPYSVQYRGNGRYFKTLDQAKEYFCNRFRCLFIISADDLANYCGLGDKEK